MIPVDIVGVRPSAPGLTVSGRHGEMEHERLAHHKTRKPRHRQRKEVLKDPYGSRKQERLTQDCIRLYQTCFRQSRPKANMDGKFLLFRSFHGQ